MTQFGQDFQAVIKKTLPNFVLGFFHRVMGYLKQHAYSHIASDINEIEAEKQNLGEDYDKYVMPFILNAMANICFDLEKYKDAIEILNKALMWQKKMLGETHPLLGMTLNNLAVVYVQQGKYEDVKVLAERSLDIYVQPTCDDYPFVAERLGGLARYFNNQGKYDKEEQCYIRAFGICEANPSSDGTLVAAASNELAMCYLRRGKLRKAKKLFKSVLSKACENEFADAGGKSSRLNRLAPKKIFKISKDDNESFTNIWQIAEERERNKTKVSDEISPPVWYKPVSFYTPTFGVALNGLEAIYKKEGKHVAAETLNHYANQKLVAPQLPPKKRDIKASRTPSPLTSPPSSPTPLARKNEPDYMSDYQIEITMQSPPPPLPIKGIKPGSTDVCQENIPILALSSTEQLPPGKDTEKSCVNIPQRFMVLPSAPPAEEDESFAVPHQIRFLEQIAELQAEIAEKDQRLAEVKRTIETHGIFRKMCLDNEETGSEVAAVTSQVAASARNVSYVKKRTAATAE